MITYSLDWEMRDGASGSEHYADELEALEEMEELITDPEVIFAGVTMTETYGGMVRDVTTIREFERGE